MFLENIECLLLRCLRLRERTKNKAYCLGFPETVFFTNVGAKVGLISEWVKYVLFYIKGKFGSLRKMLG
jgi:hypothetical protein